MSIGQKYNVRRLSKWAWRITWLTKPTVQKANSSEGD